MTATMNITKKELEELLGLQPITEDLPVFGDDPVSIATVNFGIDSDSQEAFKKYYGSHGSCTRKYKYIVPPDLAAIIKTGDWVIVTVPTGGLTIVTVKHVEVLIPPFQTTVLKTLQGVVLRSEVISLKKQRDNLLEEALQMIKNADKRTALVQAANVDPDLAQKLQAIKNLGKALPITGQKSAAKLSV